MRPARPVRALPLIAALAAALFLAREASAQGFPFNLFGDDRPRAARSRPRPPAQQRRKPDMAKPKKSEAAPASSAAEPLPPYEPQMLRLSEILGALSFLRDLCGAGDGGDWRGKMSSLLDAEAPGGARREKLTASFNRGFHGYDLTYRVCTPNARLAISRYLDEAARLSRDIAYRYGNP